LKKALQDEGVAAALAGYERVWIDTDDQGRLADEFDVQGLPHLEVLAPDGKRIAKQVGYLAPEPLQKFLRQHAGKGRDPKAGAEVEAEAGGTGEMGGERAQPAGEPAAKAKPPARAPSRDAELETLRKELETLRAEVRELRELLRAQGAERRR
jgi:thioredoxin-like negative regulator of GroEL